MKLTSPIVLTFFLIWLGSPGTSLSQAENPNKVPFTVNFSKSGGFYEQSVLVELSSLPGAQIFYTLNGEEPFGPSGKKYQRPIAVTGNLTIRAAAMRKGKKSGAFAESYFIGERHSNFPVLSLSIPPSMLFDPIDGLFMLGATAVDSLYSKPGANFWSRTEVAAHVQFFETDGKSAFNTKIGFKLFGGLSRLLPQKSFAIAARQRYGAKRLQHRVFGKDGPKKFKYLVFRNSGGDFPGTHFRDGLMTSLTEGMDLEKQAFRPCIVYINGTYWGIYNIREKVNRYFIQDHSYADKDSIDLMEHRRDLHQGSRRHYQALIRFLETHDLSKSANYYHVASQMDVSNFMNYQIAQIYFDNQDAGGNIKYWRPRQPDGKWRWILYDTDWGFGLHDPKAYQFNTLDFATRPDGPTWPNPPWSTFILRKLLENPEFKNAFINRFCDHLNRPFHPSVVMQKIDQFYQMLAPEMPRHLERWQLSMEGWNQSVDVLREFAKMRPYFVRKHLKEKFDTGEEVALTLQVGRGGAVVINQNLEIRNQTFSGFYFKNLPIQIQAIPQSGYRFSHWEGLDMDAQVQNFILPLRSEKITFKAVFEKYTHPFAGKVMVNEIANNNKQTGDWIELYNDSDQPVNLRNWILSDKKHSFTLPSVALLPKDYVVLCEDSARFYRVFPRAYSAIGSFDFGLNKRRETISLFSSDGAFIDSLAYDLPPKDSVYTLNLLLPWLDNAKISNWEMVPGLGSPNAANLYYVKSSIQKKRRLWMEIGAALGVILLCLVALYLRETGVI